jgi:hypothetical protein
MDRGNNSIRTGETIQYGQRRQFNMDRGDNSIWTEETIQYGEKKP